jgi:hypothetical protein
VSVEQLPVKARCLEIIMCFAMKLGRRVGRVNTTNDFKIIQIGIRQNEA